jgi:hypothetical protein
MIEANAGRLEEPVPETLQVDGILRPHAPYSIVPSAAEALPAHPILEAAGDPERCGKIRGRKPAPSR